MLEDMGTLRSLVDLQLLEAEDLEPWMDLGPHKPSRTFPSTARQQPLGLQGV